jgi:N-acetylglucosamine malate deacetylase 2
MGITPQSASTNPMKVLYIFPHPDDESFGPAPGMRQQIKNGHEVWLLTLTKGGATRQRHKLNLSVEEMGEVRADELRAASGVIGSKLILKDLPDSGLKGMDPRVIEKTVEEVILAVRPDVIVTYAVHGVSGFHDHLVCHAVVKRVFCVMQDLAGMPRRLAFFTLGEDVAKTGPFPLSSSKKEEIDCILVTTEDEVETGIRALDCYVTYLETIEETGIKQMVKNDISFEFFRETFDPPLNDLFGSLKI